MAHFFVSSGSLKRLIESEEIGNAYMNCFLQESLQTFLSLFSIDYDDLYAPYDQELHKLRDMVYFRKFLEMNHHVRLVADQTQDHSSISLTSDEMLVKSRKVKLQGAISYNVPVAFNKLREFLTNQELALFQELISQRVDGTGESCVLCSRPSEDHLDTVTCPICYNDTFSSWLIRGICSNPKCEACPSCL